MNSEEKSKSPVNIDVGLKAEAKLDIKAEVPKESAGRFVDAITDIIRPFSEKRGLKADLLRLQREQVLIEIAQLARERAEVEKIELHPVPTKFLVNYLEKASLEDETSELKSKWADLLVNASSQYDDRYTVYLDVLSTLTAKEAQLLDAIAPKTSFTREWLYKDAQREGGFRALITKVLTDSAANAGISELLESINLSEGQDGRFLKLCEGAKQWSGEYDTIDVLRPEHELLLKLAAIAPDHGALVLSLAVDQGGGFSSQFRTPEELHNIAELANLERNNLVALEQTAIMKYSGSITVRWAELTPFGHLFVVACSGRTQG